MSREGNQAGEGTRLRGRTEGGRREDGGRTELRQARASHLTKTCECGSGSTSSPACYPIVRLPADSQPNAFSGDNTERRISSLSRQLPSIIHRAGGEPLTPLSLQKQTKRERKEDGGMEGEIQPRRGGGGIMGATLFHTGLSPAVTPSTPLNGACHSTGPPHQSPGLEIPSGQRRNI
ncbi:unnamed protein product [Pleuronectes platessa]|uniref:Uncharacterized protein n=1 Tax=Pleuronectes platessa TaxID=8262 RepID=A0A9N7Z5D2_PLEPL|nr:unnamed protein product [Pleuronectes platessa]